MVVDLSFCGEQPYRVRPEKAFFETKERDGGQYARCTKMDKEDRIWEI